MRFVRGNGKLPLILLATLCVLFQGRFAASASEADSIAAPTRTGSDHGYEVIEGFDLVNPVPDIVPFGEGEYLLFAIQYGLIYAGDATLEVRNDAELNGRMAYHIVSVARTNKAFDMVYKVRDRHESYMDMEYLRTLRFERHLREGRFRRDKVVDFDQFRHVAIYPDREVGIPTNTQDFLSALYL